jgi:HK97 gp10 family phage protein
MSRLSGDWNRAGIKISLLCNFSGKAKEQLEKDANETLKALQNHIDQQDLNWTPLNPLTISKKGGNDKVYVETSYLRDNISVRRLNNKPKGSTLYVGASPWKVHKPSGQKLSDIMTWLEYGTPSIPARPLIRPTLEEMKKKVRENWRKFLRDSI